MPDELQRVLVTASYTRGTFDVDTVWELLTEEEAQGPRVLKDSRISYETLKTNDQFFKQQQEEESSRAYWNLIRILPYKKSYGRV